MFGFINMTPQIFINYKLKSVAHMPWRVMIYKVCTTHATDAVRFAAIDQSMALILIGFSHIH